MSSLHPRRGSAKTIRARVLAIVLIPSSVLLLVGLGASGYLVDQGIKVQNRSPQLQHSIGISVDFATSIQEERRLTLLRLGGDRQDSANLDVQRQVVSGVLAQIISLAPTMSTLAPGLDASFAQVN